MDKIYIAELLRAFDWNLTGCSIKKSFLTWQSQTAATDKIAEWEKVEYYLSDGGYSRLWVDPFDEEIFISSNSTDKVKNAWEVNPNIKNLVAEFKAIFAAAKTEEEN